MAAPAIDRTSIACCAKAGVTKFGLKTAPMEINKARTRRLITSTYVRSGQMPHWKEFDSFRFTQFKYVSAGI